MYNAKSYRVVSGNERGEKMGLKINELGKLAKSKIGSEKLEEIKDLFIDHKANALIFKPEMTNEQIDKRGVESGTIEIIKKERIKRTNVLSLIEKVGGYGNIEAPICFFGIEPAGYSIDITLETDIFKKMYVPEGEDGLDKFYEIQDNKEKEPLEDIQRKIERIYDEKGVKNDQNEIELHQLLRDKEIDYEKLIKIEPKGTKWTMFHNSEQISGKYLDIAYRIWALDKKSMSGMATKLLQKIKQQGDKLGDAPVSGKDSININFSVLPKKNTSTTIWADYEIHDNDYYSELGSEKRLDVIRKFLKRESIEVVICFGKGSVCSNDGYWSDFLKVFEKEEYLKDIKNVKPHNHNEKRDPVPHFKPNFYNFSWNDKTVFLLPYLGSTMGMDDNTLEYIAGLIRPIIKAKQEALLRDSRSS